MNTTILGAHGNDIHRNNSTYSVIKVNNKNGKNCNFLSKEPQMTFGFAWIICRQLKKPRRLGSQMIRTRFKIRYSRALIVVSMSWLPYPSLCLVIIIPEEINKVIAVYFAFHNGAYLFKCLNVVKFKSWYFPLYPYFLLLLPFSTTPSPFSSPIIAVYKCVSVVRIFRCFIVLSSYSFARLSSAHQCNCVKPLLPEILAFERTPPKLNSTFY